MNDPVFTPANRRLGDFAIDEAEIRRAWELYSAPQQVTELRVFRCKLHGDRRTGTYAGFFDSVDPLIEAIRKIEKAPGVYFIPNPLNPAILARADNRAQWSDEKGLASDKDVVQRRWLLIDIDPIRAGGVAGISATSEEKAAAEGLAMEIDAYLHDKGFPAGIIADSGNGAHITIPVDLPANDNGFCKKVLDSLKRLFDNDFAKVDGSVSNPARIWGLPGTMKCKGDDCPRMGRPWRTARILQVCNEVGRMG